MRSLLGILILAGLTPALVLAEDDLTLTSPNGQLSLLLGVAPQANPSDNHRLAYRISWKGKLLFDTSYLGFEMQAVATTVGDKPGLVNSERKQIAGDTPYNWLLAEYEQNGSLGTRLNVEARVYNDAVAFRYIIPHSPMLDSFKIEREITEFHLSPEAVIPKGTPYDLPLAVEVPGQGWISIGQAAAGNYSPTVIDQVEGSLLMTRLLPMKGEHLVAWAAKAPFTTPWRVIQVGASRTALGSARLLESLEH